MIDNMAKMEDFEIKGMDDPKCLYNTEELSDDKDCEECPKYEVCWNSYSDYLSSRG
jgi:hypothetical protein